MDDTRAEPLTDPRVQPLQLLDISDYEKLLGLVAGRRESTRMLAHKATGRFATAISRRGFTHQTPRRTSQDSRSWKALGAR